MTSIFLNRDGSGDHPANRPPSGVLGQRRKSATGAIRPRSGESSLLRGGGGGGKGFLAIPEVAWEANTQKKDKVLVTRDGLRAYRV